MNGRVWDGEPNTKKRKLCEISDREYDASPKSGHDELQQQNTTLQFDIESLKRENVRLRAELGRNGGLIQALKAALRKVETDNEHQRAELLSVRRNGERIETLKQIIRRLRTNVKIWIWTIGYSEPSCKGTPIK